LWGLLSSARVFNQGYFIYKKPKVKFRNYDCHYKLIDPIEIPVSELIKDILLMVLGIRISERMSLIIRKCSHFQRPDALPEHPFSLPVF
jgi:hypothetical protein